ncbi:MAG: OmpA family protein [Bacteroidaceae bacterium]|nr:OmpA family protein [Bacteroidaceae bacterium]
MKKILILLTAGVLMTSCVSKKQYAALQEENNKLKKEYAELQNQQHATKVELATSQTNASGLATRLDDAQREKDEWTKRYNELKKTLDNSIAANATGGININKLVDQINESNRFIKHLIEAKDRSDSLNRTLTENLTRSLTREETKEVNVQVLKGVVYVSLADNMLYKSGSYEINERASETLSKIAKIIKDYKDYDVLIEGNTDNVPISKPNIRNNWDLAALRASSVVQELQNKYGVEPKRLTAGSRGEYNPIMTNDTELGRQRNRRTQIIITPKLDEFMELIEQAPADENKDSQ